MIHKLIEGITDLDDRIRYCLVGSWTGTLATIPMAHISIIFTIVCGVLSMVATVMASYFAIRNSRAAERNQAAQFVKAMEEICLKCQQAGLEFCPVPDNMKPDRCPKKKVVRGQ